MSWVTSPTIPRRIVSVRVLNVVSIAGREYSCFATLSGGKFHDAGTLAITTNEVYIWLDAHAAPKLIESDYKPPYFPPGF